MSYAPISDGFFAHPKVLALGSDIDALALWTLALSWSTKHVTDGLLPPQAPRMVLATTHHHTRNRMIRALVRVGLWDANEDGSYQIHDFLDWQRPAKVINEIRRARRVAGHLGGIRSAEARAQAKAQALASSNVQPTVTVTVTDTVTVNSTRDAFASPPAPPARSARVSPECPAGFTAFWSAYPKRVGKDAARKAWSAKHCEACAAAVLAGLERQRAFLARESGKYIPNPATWLNQGRWQDDPPKNGHQAGFGSLDVSGIQAFLEANNP